MDLPAMGFGQSQCLRATGWQEVVTPGQGPLASPEDLAAHKLIHIDDGE